MTAKTNKKPATKTAAKKAPAKRAPRVSKAKQAELESRIESTETIPQKPTKPANPKSGSRKPKDDIANPGWDKQAADARAAETPKPARHWATGPKKNRSTVPGPCAIVWELFDVEFKRAGSLDAMVRKDVIAQAMAEGVNIDTAKTQYQRRRAAYLSQSTK